MSKFLVTGGVQRGRAIWLEEFQHYKTAMLAVVDMDRGTAKVLLEYESPSHLCAPTKPSIVFKCSTLRNGILYLTTQTEVLLYSWPELKLLAHITHPSLNDVHHALPVGDEIWVVSTGLDLVVRFSKDGDLLGYLPTIDEKPFTRFDEKKDYRLVPSTKPHISHPNFLSEVDGDIWVTRCSLKDSANLSDLKETVSGFPERIHDGESHPSGQYFTTVNGQVVVVDAKTRALTVYPLSPMVTHSDPLGWCRGLALVDEARVVVGFSRIRTTKLHDNLRWLKNRGQMKTFQPTRIAEFDLKEGRLVREFNLEEIGMAAVFSVLKV